MNSGLVEITDKKLNSKITMYQLTFHSSEVSCKEKIILPNKINLKAYKWKPMCNPGIPVSACPSYSDLLI